MIAFSSVSVSDRTLNVYGRYFIYGQEFSFWQEIYQQNTTLGDITTVHKVMKLLARKEKDISTFWLFARTIDASNLSYLKGSLAREDFWF